MRFPNSSELASKIVMGVTFIYTNIKMCIKSATWEKRI